MPHLLRAYFVPHMTDSRLLTVRMSQAHERLIAMNDPAKGGSEYLQQKVTAARDALVEQSSEAPKDAK